MVERVELGTPEWDSMHAEHLARYFFAAEYAHGRRVLDAGTGCGYGAVILKAYGAATVQAVDIDVNTIEAARRRFGSEGIQFLVDDCERLDRVETPVDLVCSLENIEHLNHPSKFLDAATRVLSRDGLLVCSTPDRAAMPPFVDEKPWNPYHKHEWYRDELAELLLRYFSDVEIRVQVTTLAFDCRDRAAKALRREPALRIARGIRKLLSRKKQWPDIRGLAVPSVVDFPILHASVASFVGTPLSHVAICKKANR